MDKSYYFIVPNFTEDSGFDLYFSGDLKYYEPVSRKENLTIEEISQELGNN